MQFKYSLGVISLCSALFLVGCNDDNSSVSQTPTVQEQKQKLQPIIIQGALPVESERMASKLENKTVETVGGWTFQPVQRHSGKAKQIEETSIDILTSGRPLTVWPEDAQRR